MKRGLHQRWAAAVGALALVACAEQTPPLYHWDEYQPQVYQYFKGEGSSEQEQIGKLEASAQRALAKGEALPPGFHAHLGLLYLKAGNSDSAREAFLAEQAEFPESMAYMDFLLKNFKN